MIGDTRGILGRRIVKCPPILSLNTLSFLIPQLDNQGFRQRHGFVGFLIGVHPHNLAFDQGCIAVFREYLNKKSEAGSADSSGSDVNFDFVIKMAWGEEFDGNLDHMEVGSCLFDMFNIIVGKVPQILVDRRIEIGQVMGKEDDALSIGLCIANTKGKRKFKLGFGHGSVLHLTYLVSTNILAITSIDYGELYTCWFSGSVFQLFQGGIYAKIKYFIFGFTIKEFFEFLLYGFPQIALFPFFPIVDTSPV